MKKALNITITGIVQGVGFRPFIYRIATKHGLKGYVINRGGSEVEVWIEGEEANLRYFLKSLNREKPLPSLIYNIKIKEVIPKNYANFAIRKSIKELSSFSMIPPDIGICNQCLSEIKNQKSRWYNYPFNSCAWCGPRFSIMYRIPYDRVNTSMREFPLCEKCKAEYNDPNNIRRFHAQGISCPTCGPRIWLTDNLGQKIDVKDPLEEAARLIDEGFIVGIKGLGGFHIAALATDDNIVLELRKRKERPQKPFALMALDIEYIKSFGTLTDRHKALLESYEKPIVLIPKKNSPILSKYVAPGLDLIGVMLPYTGIHYILLSKTRDKFLIMTSGNKSGRPLIKDNDDALAKLKGIVDYFVMHNRKIVNRIDDSVVRLTNGNVSFLRRSRGYVPKWIHVPFKFQRSIIALGAYLSNVGSIAFDRYIIPTQYIGDMDNLENIDFLFDSINFLMSMYKVKWNSSIIVSDLNPAYSTTLVASRLASKYGVNHIKVQHHHAHIVAAAIENGIILDDRHAIGIAIDGVGWGTDGSVWGGEILLSSFKEFSRLGHLEYITLPFGDLSTKYPMLLLMGFILENEGEEKLISFIGDIDKKLLPSSFNYEILIRKFREFPKASSVGRFLELIGTILGIYPIRTYEGELEMKLESLARGGSIIPHVKFDVENGVIITKDVIRKIIELKNSFSVHDLAYTVLIRLGETLGSLAYDMAKEYGTEYIIVSGGAAVNDYIIRGIKKGVRNMKILFNKELPPGDGCISVGQTVISNFILK